MHPSHAAVVKAAAAATEDSGPPPVKKKQRAPTGAKVRLVTGPDGEASPVMRKARGSSGRSMRRHAKRLSEDLEQKLTDASTPIAGAALKKVKNQALKEDGGHIQRVLTFAGLDGTPPTMQALVLDPQFNETSKRQKTTVRKTKFGIRT